LYIRINILNKTYGSNLPQKVNNNNNLNMKRVYICISWTNCWGIAIETIG
jgi:hypothetical protein